MNNYLEKGKELVQRAGPFRILIVIISGILLLLISYGNAFRGDSPAEDSPVSARVEEPTETNQEAYREQMEEQVESILEHVDGVGTVEVMITLKASREKVTLKDNAQDAGRSEEKSVLIEDENKNTSPYIVQEMEPEVEGIVIVCAGGDSPTIQREIIAAISALFPVESHKIKVMKSKEAK